jgi:5-methylcytosine-specific restriction endonuclease McrA
MPMRKKTLQSVPSRPSREHWRDTNKDYDTHWNKLRASFLAEHPLCECEDCLAGGKRLTPANCVDHVLPIEYRPDLRLSWDNLRSMDSTCHNRHTMRMNRMGYRNDFYQRLKDGKIMGGGRLIDWRDIRQKPALNSELSHRTSILSPPDPSLR